MKPFLILTISLLLAKLTLGQTGQEIDSIKKKFLEMVKNVPPPPDSVLQKRNQIRSKPPDRLYPVTIGNLQIETGKIIACDPIVLRDAHPFAQRFPTGSFPVQLSIAQLGKDERIAFSRIYFSANPVSAANVHFTQLLRKDDELWETVFPDETQKNYRNTWQFVLYRFPGHNLACFSTGLGDGTYGTYVGYDAGGNICRLLTDFGLITWWKQR